MSGPEARAALAASANRITAGAAQAAQAGIQALAARGERGPVVTQRLALAVAVAVECMALVIQLPALDILRHGLTGALAAEALGC